MESITQDRIRIVRVAPHTTRAFCEPLCVCARSLWVTRGYLSRSANCVVFASPFIALYRLFNSRRRSAHWPRTVAKTQELFLAWGDLSPAPPVKGFKSYDDAVMNSVCMDDTYMCSGHQVKKAAKDFHSSSQ
eukprot:3822612-Rhodomonas_salina.1